MMEIEQHTSSISKFSNIPMLEDIPSTRKLVESLYSQGKINPEERFCILNFLTTDREWGLWISRLLLFLGTALILTGIIFFFAYNWAAFGPIMKLLLIQMTIIACLLGVFFYSLDYLAGQILLLAASVLVGVFMAVFGQIYQAGADSYQLFMMWSVLILGWTLISKFAPQWILLLLITNLFLFLYWKQEFYHTHNMYLMVNSSLLVLNASALVLHEVFAIKKNCLWLQARWTRIVLALVVLVIMFNSIFRWIFDKGTAIIFLNGIFGFLGHGIIFLFYRYKKQDICVLTMTTFSACLLILALFARVFMYTSDSIAFFFIFALLSLGIFSGASIYLRYILKEFEVSHE